MKLYWTDQKLNQASVLLISDSGVAREYSLEAGKDL
jgi:hypothetical protein